MNRPDSKIDLAGPGLANRPGRAGRRGPASGARCLLAPLVCLLGLLVPAQAVAEEAVSDDWQFQLVPYAWALAADGDVTIRGRKSDLDLSFDDILDELNYGIMLEGEARKGRFGILANILYADLGNSTKTGGVKIDPDVDLFWGTFAGYYRLGPYDLDSAAGEAGPRVIVDPYAGVRYTYLDIDLDISGGPDVDGDKDWAEPIVGLRTLWELTPRWGLTAAGDVGGFGVGSDFAWQALGLVSYRFGLFGDDNARVAAGYRALHQDYSSGSGADKFEWDVTLHGPIFALAIEF
jgi:hypothetical protein